MVSLRRAVLTQTGRGSRRDKRVRRFRSRTLAVADRAKTVRYENLCYTIRSWPVTFISTANSKFVPSLSESSSNFIIRLNCIIYYFIASRYVIPRKTVIIYRYQLASLKRRLGGSRRAVNAVLGYGAASA